MKDFKFCSKDIFGDMPCENAILKGIDFEVIGHFGNVINPVLHVESANGFCNFMSGYNVTRHCGWLIKALVELFELEQEDGICVSSVRNIPCRLIYRNRIPIAIGHLYKDRFFCTEHFLDWCTTYMEK